MDKNIKEIQDMPKVILHLHLDGSLRPETVQEWLKEQGEEHSLEEVKKMLMVEKDCRDLNEYLTKFDLPVRMLQTKEHIERAVYELYEDLANQNVIYAEVRFAPSKHTFEGLSYDEVVEAAINGLNKAKSELSIDGNLILCCMRGEGKENYKENLDTVKVAQEYVNKGVCAIDLAGAEALFKTENFENIFKLAKEKNIPFTIHAGEADGPESIKKALEFGAKRIGHGVRCLEDNKLVSELVKNEIPLEICPISNLQTQAVTGVHPIEELYKKGINATISTDNNTVSNTDIIQEYEYILNNTNLTIGDLYKMNKNAARSIFGTPNKKAELIAKIEKNKSNNLENKELEMK